MPQISFPAYTRHQDQPEVRDRALQGLCPTCTQPSPGGSLLDPQDYKTPIHPYHPSKFLARLLFVCGVKQLPLIVSDKCPGDRTFPVAGVLNQIK